MFAVRFGQLTVGLPDRLEPCPIPDGRSPKPWVELNEPEAMSPDQ